MQDSDGVCLGILLWSEQNIIPDSGNHIEFLTKECIKSFFFSSNVNIQLTFQMFDNDWDCFVDLESDYIAKNKDKLN